MTENEIELLLDVLDKDGDNEINYRYCAWRLKVTNNSSNSFAKDKLKMTI